MRGCGRGPHRNDGAQLIGVNPAPVPKREKSLSVRRDRFSLSFRPCCFRVVWFEIAGSELLQVSARSVTGPRPVHASTPTMLST